jgi:hypothetical protein
MKGNNPIGVQPRRLADGCMAHSITSAFSEPKDFAAALRGEGYCSLLITGQGKFQAQLTQISLGKIRLSASQETLARIAFVEIPADAVHVWFPSGNMTAPVCRGIRTRAGELMLFCPGDHLHTRTDGASGWGSIRLPFAEFVRYNIAIIGDASPIASTGQRWRPPPESYRQLRELHAAAIRMAARCPHWLVDNRVAHGLEQQILHALIECLPENTDCDASPIKPEHPNLMAAYEELLQSGRSASASMIEICARFQTSEEHMRQLCADHLGMSLRAYDRLRRT